MAELYSGFEPDEARSRAFLDRPTVTIVSDVLLYREGLAASLQRNGRLSVLETVSGHDALPSISAQPPDAILLDGSIDDSLRLAWAAAFVRKPARVRQTGSTWQK